MVTKGIGERMVKPATELLWAGFFLETKGTKASEAHRITREEFKMNLLRRLYREEDGQGLVEYTLVVVLVTLVFWMGVRDTHVGDGLAQAWAKIMDCVTSPFSCSA